MTNTDNSFTVPKEVMDKFDNPEQFLDTERKEMDKLPKPNWVETPCFTF